MGITSDRPGREFTPDEVRLAETIAGQITGAIEATRLLEQVQKRAVAGERSRLARDLHDSVTQSLYSLDLFANAIHQALSAGRTERVTDHAEKIRSLSQSALADLRLLIFELRPPLLDQAGLAGALRARLESVEARAGFKTEIEVQAERSLPAIVEAELYAVALEALNNVLKHARADQVTVKLAYDEQRCCLTIRDDGLGFDPEIANNGGGFGLQTMRERVERIGGTMTLDTSPGRGTTVSVEVNA
jgi:signal transduction histidine kinase